MTCGITVAPTMPVASRMLSVPREAGDEEVAGDFAAVRRGVEELVDEGDDDDADQHRDRRLEPAEAAPLQGEQGEGADAGDQPGGEERDAEEQVEAERGADDLGQVAGHRDHLGLQPEADRGAAGEAFAAELGEVLAGGDAELRRLRLDQHRDQVGGEHDPEQQVAELGAAADVGGEVAGVDVGDGGDEGRAEEGPDAGEAAAVAVERAVGGVGDGGLAGERLLGLRALRGAVRRSRRAAVARSGPGIGLPCGSWLGSPSFAAISASRSSEM